MARKSLAAVCFKEGEQLEGGFTLQKQFPSYIGQLAYANTHLATNGIDFLPIQLAGDPARSNGPSCNHPLNRAKNHILPGLHSTKLMCGLAYCISLGWRFDKAME